MKRTKYYNFIEYLLAINIILNCNSIFVVGSNIVKTVVNISFQLLLILSIIYKLHYITPKRYLKGYIYLFASLFLCYILVLFICNLHLYNISLFITFFFDPLLFVIYLTFTNNKHIDYSLFFKIEDITIFLAISSLILWALVMLHFLKPNISIISSWNSQGTPSSVPGYFGLLFLHDSYRNSSIFAEAPMFSYVLCISLFVELFMRHSNRIFTWRVIIILLAIFSSYSTTGIMVSIPIIIYKIIISSHSNILEKGLLIILIPITFIFLKEVLFNKMGNSTNLSSSYNIRMNDITSSIIAWKQHPFIGNGLKNTFSIDKNMYWFRLLPNSGVSTGLSTGFFTVLALGGILWALFYIIPTILALFKCSYKIKGIALANFILFIYTIISMTYLCILVFSYLMACYILSVINKKIVRPKGSDSLNL